MALSPLYRLAQAGVDQVMFGERDRPDRALRHLAARLGDTVDPLEVPDVLVAAVASALRLPFVSLHRGTGTGTVRAASRGLSFESDRIVEFPICYAGERLAVLLAAPGPAKPDSAARTGRCCAT